MTYPVISARRLAYDINGTEIGKSGGSLSGGITGWLTSTEKGDLNGNTILWSGTTGVDQSLWWFFPELTEIEYMCMLAQRPQNFILEGSVDTTNGIDGTWETPTFPSGSPLVNNYGEADWYREYVKEVSFSGPIKVLRAYIDTRSIYEGRIGSIHLYGRKAAGETPDDILIVTDEATPSEITALKDWGDRPEGTTVYDSFRLKNASTSMIANSINIQLNHGDFALSWNPDGPWQATLDIASLDPEGVSAPIYIRNQLDPPPLILGPRVGRIIIGVGSWS